MNTQEKCTNCGGEYGLHHCSTDQCPVGGRETPVGRKQEWKTTTFQAEPKQDTTQAARIAELEAYLFTILSIPAVCDLEKSISEQPFECANPITDARAFLKKSA